MYKESRIISAESDEAQENFELAQEVNAYLEKVLKDMDGFVLRAETLAKKYKQENDADQSAVAILIKSQRNLLFFISTAPTIKPGYADLYALGTLTATKSLCELVRTIEDMQLNMKKRN